ncbi:MAG: hypothetical protein AABX07_00035 [Nanoarchaeota archaeon]
MAEIQDMDEARVKRIVELMLKNDAPMQCMLEIHDFFRKGYIESIESYIALTKQALCVRDIYAEIKVDDLDDETGRIIIQANKPLIVEYFRESMPIWEMAREAGFKPQIVPARIDEIDCAVNLSIRKYQGLLGFKIYDEAYHKIGYITHDVPPHTSNIDWFLTGKPVIYHSEKLPQLVEFAQKTARTK